MFCFPLHSRFVVTVEFPTVSSLTAENKHDTASHLRLNSSFDVNQCLGFLWAVPMAVARRSDMGLVTVV